MIILSDDLAMSCAQVLEPNEEVIRQVVRDSAQRRAPL